LVPHDFTPVGDNALNYAINLAKIIQSNVDILHVVKTRRNAQELLPVRKNYRGIKGQTG